MNSVDDECSMFLLCETQAAMAVKGTHNGTMNNSNNLVQRIVWTISLAAREQLAFFSNSMSSHSISVSNVLLLLCGSFNFL